MINEEKIDQMLKQALSPVTPDKEINQKLKQELEGRKMKKFKVKKTVLLVAACCMLLGTVGLASSGIISYTSAWSWSSGEKDFTKLGELEAEVGFSVKAIEQFQNGYQFSDMTITNNTGYDENGNAMTHYKDIAFTYKKDGEDTLSIHVEREENAQSYEEREPDLTKSIEDIEVTYKTDTYKWVPAGYEPTEEDKINMERDDYFISEGGEDPISEGFVSHVTWVQDGIYYSIMNAHGKTEPEVLFQMAEELILSE